jgi:hypothetical protein
VEIPKYTRKEKKNEIYEADGFSCFHQPTENNIINFKGYTDLFDNETISLAFNFIHECKKTESFVLLCSDEIDYGEDKEKAVLKKLMRVYAYVFVVYYNFVELF